VSRFAVLGTGGWGTAIAHLLAAKGLDVCLWGRDANYLDAMARTRENPRALPGAKLHPGIRLEADAARALDGARAVFVAIPAQFLRATMAPLAARIPTKAPIVSGVKGLEIGTLERPTRILAGMLGSRPIGILSGPSHAEEIVRGLPVSLALAFEDLDLARKLREETSHAGLRLYVTSDVLGVELAGALKNVLAIAAGACDGLELGDNAKAALVTRALAEMTRYGAAHGAKTETFAGLAGIGDLITTCYSKHGRNRAVGERLARGESLERILGSTTQVAEGVWTAKALFGSQSQQKVRGELASELPICGEVYEIAHAGKDPRRSVIDLMTRPPRD
jgi:glycerol-3-phosphate dehydrogenase (NAD(P)+)